MSIWRQGGGPQIIGHIKWAAETHIAEYQFSANVTMSDKKYPPIKQSTAQTDEEQVRHDQEKPYPFHR